MNFTKDGEDLSKIIKKYRCDNGYYDIQYLDGSEAIYISTSPNEEERLKQIMISQAIDRQNKINIKALKLKDFVDHFLAWACSIETITLASRGYFSIEFFMLILTFICIKRVVKTSKKLRELKKYKLFLEMINDLDTINNSDFLKCVEFDKFHQIDFDINNLDQYTLGDVMAIKDNLQKVKEKEK